MVLLLNWLKMTFKYVSTIVYRLQHFVECDLRSDDPVDPPRRIWLRTSSVSLVLAMLFLICIIDSWEHRLGWRSIFFTAWHKTTTTDIITIIISTTSIAVTQHYVDALVLVLDPPCHWVWGHSESTVCWWCLCQWGTWTPHWGKCQTPGRKWASLETNTGTYSSPLPWWSPVNQTLQQHLFFEKLRLYETDPFTSESKWQWQARSDLIKSVLYLTMNTTFQSLSWWSNDGTNQVFSFLLLYLHICLLTWNFSPLCNSVDLNSGESMNELV